MISRKKRWLIGVAIGTVLVGSIGVAEAQGIPVFDDSNLLEWITQLGEDEKAFALQIEQYVTQIKDYFGEEWSWITQAGQYATEISHYLNDAQMLMNFAHHPTLGAAMGLLNMAGMGSMLPFNPQAVMNLVSGLSYGQGGFGEVQGLLNQVSSFAGGGYSASHLYTPTDASWASSQINANANGLAGSQGMAMAAYTDYSNHLGVLPGLRTNAGSTTTAKDAMDTNNMIGLEVAWNLNELGRAQQVATLSMLQDRQRIQQGDERLACELEMFRTGGAACPSGNNGPIAGGAGGPNGGSETMPVPPEVPLPPNTGNALANGPDPQMPVPPLVVDPPPYLPPAAPPVIPAAPQGPVGPVTPAFVDPNNPANNNAALANVDGGNGQEQNFAGPDLGLAILPPD